MCGSNTAYYKSKQLIIIPPGIIVQKILIYINGRFISKNPQGKASELILDLAKKEGGATTFLGMIIQKKKKKRQKLQLFGIGDTNMFLIRNKKIKYSFPITSVESFTDQTIGLCSIDNASQKIPELKEFNAKRGDIVILATDALAKWIFKYYKKGGEYSWKRILKNKDNIQNFIDELRDTNKIDDDDTTCIIIRI